MRKIAFICFGDIQNANNGYLVRCSMLVNKLLEQGDVVEVYQFCDKSEIDHKKSLTIHSIKVRHEKKRDKRNFVEKTIGFRPLKELYFPVEGFLKLNKYKKELKTADFIYIESCPLYQAFLLAKMLKRPIVLDTHSVNKDIALKLKNTKKLEGTIRTAIWHTIENSVLNASSKIIVVSQNDANFIVDHYGIDRSSISIIENEVEAANEDKYFEDSRKIKDELGLTNRFTACFIGDLGAIQNKEARDYIEKKLSKELPGVFFIMIGNNPEKHKSHDNIHYTGFVDAVDPYIMMADICIAPLAVGSGTKTKVLDYMKYQKQIIATNVALEGIEYRSMSNVTQSDLKDFAKSISNIRKSIESPVL